MLGTVAFDRSVIWMPSASPEAGGGSYPLISSRGWLKVSFKGTASATPDKQGPAMMSAWKLAARNQRRMHIDARAEYPALDSPVALRREIGPGKLPERRGRAAAWSKKKRDLKIYLQRSEVNIWKCLENRFGQRIGGRHIHRQAI